MSWVGHGAPAGRQGHADALCPWRAVGGPADYDGRAMMAGSFWLRHMSKAAPPAAPLTRWHSISPGCVSR